MEPLLQIDDLQVAVPARRRLARRPLLHGIDLQVAPGERVALLGASGSGRSLIASALLGTLAPSLKVRAACCSTVAPSAGGSAPSVTAAWPRCAGHCPRWWARWRWW